MKNIDFLPPRYKERKTARHAHLWRVAVLLLLGGVVASAAVGQSLLRRSIESQVDSVAAQHTLAQARNAQFAVLQRELKQIRAESQLYAYLQHPWPKTQILAAISSSIPPEVVLSTLRISKENPLTDAVRNQRRGGTRRQGKDDEELARLLPAERDLAVLAEEFGKRQTIAHVEGRTSDIAALHRYVAHLGQSPLVAQAELQSIDSVVDGKGSAGSQFELRIVVTPDYGQIRTRPEKSHHVAVETNEPRGDDL